jgi:HEAT repeat protein
LAREPGQVDAIMAPLGRAERTLAHFIAGPGSERVDPDGALGRLSTLGGWSDELWAAFRGPNGAELDLGLIALSQVDEHWAQWPQAPEEDRLTACAVFALARRLPLEMAGFGGASDDELLSRTLEPYLAFAVGLAAEAGDPGARSMLREALAQSPPVARDEVVLSFTLGLGGGLYGLGLKRLMALSRGAVSDEDEWAHALVRAALALTRRAHPEHSEGVITASTLLTILCHLRTVDAAEQFVRALGGTRWQAALVACARDSFCDIPPEVRAVVAQAFLAGFEPHGGRVRLDAPVGLVRERSAPVLALILDLLARITDAVPDEFRATLGRAYADHPDVSVRRALARAIPPRAVTVRTSPSPAWLLVLPPDALARDELDRLRVALWTGDSDRLVDLATAVPLDRRSAARESLLSALEIPHAALRRAIVEAIGRIGSHVDGARLVDAARRYRALEGTVAAALRELGAKSCAEGLAEVYRRRLKWADDDAVDDYCAIAGPEKLSELRRALETRYYPPARSGAARALARHAGHEAVFALRSAGLSDTSEASRLAALAALHDLTGASPALGELAGYALLFKPTNDLPDTVARAREVGHAAMAGIRRTLARGSWRRRCAACEALGGIAGDDVVPVLAESLQDPDEDVRLAALEALVEHGWTPSNAREYTLQELAARRTRELVTHPHRIDRPTLVGALALGGQVFRREVLEALDALDDFFPTPAEAAFISAARGDVERAATLPDGLDAVLRVADHTWHRFPHRSRIVRGLNALPVDRIAEALATAHDELGWRALQSIALALFRTDASEAAEAIDTLGRFVEEPDDDVRRIGLQCLAWCGTPEAAAQVARGLESPFQEDRDFAARTLGTFGSRAIDAIDRLMASPWWEDRQGAAAALSRWREELSLAVDRLIILAVDPEHRVAQTARDGLIVHGILPSDAAICRALAVAQSFSIEGLEPWLGLHRHPTAAPGIAHALDILIEESPADVLPQRLGLVALFRAHHLAHWLEQVALGIGHATRPGDASKDAPDASRPTEPKPGRTAPERHLGVRVAAAEALRNLIRASCNVCLGEGTARCPACGGAGRTPCALCEGRGTTVAPCPEPDCESHGNLRRIGGPRCQTCRGRGEILVACGCESGRVRCALCEAEGRIVCSGCGGTGTILSEV